jgi:hypothetical protein
VKTLKNNHMIMQLTQDENGVLEETEMLEKSD